MKVYIDGIMCDRASAKISVYDHGLLYGDGIFEGIRIYNGSVFLLERHIKRLFDSARAIDLGIPLSYNEMCDAVKETVAADSRNTPGSDGYIRLVVTRGEGDLGMDPVKCAKPSVIIIVDDIVLYPPEMYDSGISVITSSLRRPAGDVLNPRIKSLNYLNNIMAKIEARRSNAFEAILLNQEGFIAECTGDNIFMVKDGVIRTPSLSEGILGGITREFVISLIGAIPDIDICESRLTQYDLYVADECFLTGSGAEIIPVVQADGRTIGNGSPGERTLKVLELFRERTATYKGE